MSYYHQDPNYGGYEYEYDDYGNHGNDGYEECEPYSDYVEPDHYPDPTPPEPDYHGQYDDAQHHNNADYGDRPNQWETGRAAHEHEGHEPKGFEHERSEVHEQGELVYDDENEAYGHREHGYEGEYQSTTLEYENMERYNGVHEPHGPRYDDESHELGELDRTVDRQEYEPQGFEGDDDEAPQHGEPVYEGTTGYIHPDFLPPPPLAPASPTTPANHLPTNHLLAIRASLNTHFTPSHTTSASPCDTHTRTRTHLPYHIRHHPHHAPLPLPIPPHALSWTCLRHVTKPNQRTTRVRPLSTPT